MRKTIIAALIAAVTLPIATPALADPPPWSNSRHNRERHHDHRDKHRDRHDWKDARRYDYNRWDRRDDRYYADRYYRDDRRYRERRLTRADRIYRGRDGRYYCRRSDGTTGLIVGAVAGGLLGNAIDNGNSSLLGTLLGAGGGALLGREIDRGDVKCR
jgi:hypothetical protein